MNTPPPTVSEIHKHIRDEQFWFTTAVVGFNALAMKDGSALRPCLLVLTSVLVSLFGLHLVISRSVRDAIDGGRIFTPPAPPINNKTATPCQRLRYTFWEFGANVQHFPYVFAEFSGSLFYLLLIVLSFVGVAIQK